MTKDEKVQVSSSSHFAVPLKENKISSDMAITKASNTENCSIASQQSITSLNFSTGISSFCLQSIISSEQLQEARAKIASDRNEGKNLFQQLQEAKKLTAGICYKNRAVRLGESVFNICKEKVEQKNNEINKKLKRKGKLILH